MTTVLAALFILVCLLLIAVILLQKGRGGGLSGAFGGAGGHSAFGTRTGDMFTWVTVVLTGLFLLLAIVAVKVYVPPTAQARSQGAPATAPATQPAPDETLALPPAPVEAPATAPGEPVTSN